MIVYAERVAGTAINWAEAVVGNVGRSAVSMFFGKNEPSTKFEMASRPDFNEPLDGWRL